MRKILQTQFILQVRHILKNTLLESFLKQVIEAHTDLNVELTSGVAGGSGTIHSGMESGILIYILNIRE